MSEKEALTENREPDRKPSESIPDGCLLFWHYSLGVQLQNNTWVSVGIQCCVIPLLQQYSRNWNIPAEKK